MLYLLAPIASGALAALYAEEVIWALLVGVPVLTVLLLHHATGRGFFVSAPALLGMTYLGMSYLGAVLPGRTRDALPSTSVQETATMYMLAIVGFCVAGLLVASHSGLRPSVEVPSLQRRLRVLAPPRNSRTILKLLILMVTISLAVSFVLYYQGRLPLVEALSAAIEDPSGTEAREIYLDARLGLYYSGIAMLEQFRYGLGPFANLTLVVLAMIWHHRAYAWLGIALIPVTSLMLLGSSQRHPIAAFLLWAAITVAYVAPATFRRAIAPLIVVGVVTLWLQTYLIGRFTKTGDVTADILASLLQLFDRFVATHSSLAFELVEYVRHLPPRLGNTWLNDLVNYVPFIPDQPQAFSLELFTLVTGRTGSISPLSLFEGYANFGFAGPFLVGVVLGTLLMIIHVAVLRLAGRSHVAAIDVIFLAYVTYSFTRAGYGGLISPLSVGLIPATAVWVFLRSLAESGPTTATPSVVDQLDDEQLVVGTSRWPIGDGGSSARPASS
jgi:hypothetical protein